jgi:signal transduction histidine kinase
MRILSSLRSRIFLASAVLAVFAIGAAIYLVNIRVSEEAERTLQREIIATAALVDQLRTRNAQTFTQMARFIADAPKLKAAVDTNDPPTVQDIANGYQQQLKSNVLLVTNKGGDVLASVGALDRPALLAASRPATRDAMAGRERVNLLAQPDGILHLVTVPISIGLVHPDILGTLSAGFLLDNALATQLKQITGSEVAFGMDGRILAATLPRETYPALSERLRIANVSHVSLAGEEYVALGRPLASIDAGASADAEPVALILRSRTEQLKFLDSIHTGLAVTALVAVILATLLSFAVARTITSPLAAITDVMREVAATGDLTRKIAVRQGARWDDEDARLLATTFNTLTESIGRFQREISQKERLSSLGRLSTVIAHEVRNPLMIIKAALHTLKRGDASAAAVHEAVTDIDEEVARLNWLVNEVLDFARPIQFEFAPTDVNALCRDSAAASEKSAPGTPAGLDLDPVLPLATTDGERLRVALVNLLVNARHAVDGRDGDRGPAVWIKTERERDRAVITVADRGTGIAEPDLPHVFDPYFTTKRGGTGLGLPIAKNIVEGLGGSISVTSAPGRGTSIRVEIPLLAPSAR